MLYIFYLLIAGLLQNCFAAAALAPENSPCKLDAGCSTKCCVRTANTFTCKKKAPGQRCLSDPPPPPPVAPPAVPGGKSKQAAAAPPPPAKQRPAPLTTTTTKRPAPKTTTTTSTKRPAPKTTTTTSTKRPAQLARKTTTSSSTTTSTSTKRPAQLARKTTTTTSTRPAKATRTPRPKGPVVAAQLPAPAPPAPAPPAPAPPVQAPIIRAAPIIPTSSTSSTTSTSTSTSTSTTSTSSSTSTLSSSTTSSSTTTSSSVASTTSSTSQLTTTVTSTMIQSTPPPSTTSTTSTLNVPSSSSTAATTTSSTPAPAPAPEQKTSTSSKAESTPNTNGTPPPPPPPNVPTLSTSNMPNQKDSDIANSSASAPSPIQDSKVMIPTLIAIVILGLAGILLIAYCIRRRRQTKPDKGMEQGPKSRETVFERSVEQYPSQRFTPNMASMYSKYTLGTERFFEEYPDDGKGRYSKSVPKRYYSEMEDARMDSVFHDDGERIVGRYSENSRAIPETNYTESMDFKTHVQALVGNVVEVENVVVEVGNVVDESSDDYMDSTTTHPPPIHYTQSICSSVGRSSTTLSTFEPFSGENDWKFESDSSSILTSLTRDSQTSTPPPVPPKPTLAISTNNLQAPPAPGVSKMYSFLNDTNSPMPAFPKFKSFVFVNSARSVYSAKPL